MDTEDKISVTYRNGAGGHIRQTMDISREQHKEYAEIIGTKGKVWTDDVSNPHCCKVLDLEGNVIKELLIAPQIVFRRMPPMSGYGHEFIAFEMALREGWQECAEVAHAQTLTIAKVMTEARRQAGIEFPFEK